MSIKINENVDGSRYTGVGDMDESVGYAAPHKKEVITKRRKYFMTVLELLEKLDYHSLPVRTKIFVRVPGRWIEVKEVSVYDNSELIINLEDELEGENV